MKIFLLCIVKNEADIIEECLRSAAQWADRIFVYDGQSTDGTWEKVCAMQSEVIVAWKQDAKVFQESLRRDIYEAFRHEASDGDWWGVLDADEIFVQNPRPLLERIPMWQYVIWAISIEYYLTHQDVKTLDFNAPMSVLLPSLRHYRIENSEVRFFKHRIGLTWHAQDGWPRHLGIAAAERPYIKHYKYRSPRQMQLRLDTRRNSLRHGAVDRPQYHSTQWEQEIVDESTVDCDRQDGFFHIHEDKLPRHQDSWPRLLVKMIMHGLHFWP